MEAKNPTRKIIILQIRTDGVYYNPKSGISWERTNFPHKNDFVIHTRENIFWEVEMLNYDKATGILFVRVINFYPDDPGRIKQQKPKYAISRIHFSKIEWTELQAILSYYKAGSFSEIRKQDNPQNTPAKVAIEFTPPYLKPDKTGLLEELNHKKADEKKDIFSTDQEIAFAFSFPLIKSQFHNGCVRLKKRIVPIKEQIEIVIENEHIIPEFDYIKPFFAKALNTRRITVKGKVYISNRNIVKIRAYSPEIKTINADLIDSVRRLRFEDLLKKPAKIDIDKDLFTSEDFFDHYEPELGNTNRMTELEFLKEIMDRKNIRNRKQLEYLSGKLQHPNSSIKFTLNPNFGFLFHVAGNEMNHFIWELLDSHATYIWSFDKIQYSTDFSFRSVEAEINKIRDNGRMPYLISEKGRDYIFSKVNHEHANSTFKDPFPKWRMRLNEKLV